MWGRWSKWAKPGRLCTRTQGIGRPLAALSRTTASDSASRLTTRWQLRQTSVGGTTATGERSTVAWQ